MGATQSIVDLSLVSKIGVPTQKLDTKITLKAVNGQLIEITEGVLVKVKLEEDLSMSIKFIVDCLRDLSC
ncbi:hypothetical protein BB559_002936 [Furculomyces boomerangus]|uniref:Uncharacterized protein n=1 Tax=Furculomyces boomerangus TaxID=61424 RepID=A0A2T9YR15_9FUNG|nr:hypothetical protein BB559_002936 [Furculomyces boomerangus]